MDTSVINNCLAMAVQGKAPFLEVRTKLAETGVERYTTDLVGLRIHYYSSDGGVYTAQLKIESTPVAATFDTVKVKEAILGIQAGNLSYQEYLRLAMFAGCSYYEVFLVTGKVMYFGRDGGYLVEPFEQWQDHKKRASS